MVRLSSLIVGLALALSGCVGSAMSTPIARHSRTPNATPSHAPTATATTQPSDPALFTGFQYSDIVRVEVNGLAVRHEPSLTSPLVQGIRVVGVPAPEPIGEVRLNPGDFVSVHLGPLPIGDIVWYLVRPAEDGRLGYSTISWEGWAAASVGQDQYWTLHRRPAPEEYESWPPGGPHTFMVAGTGDYDSGPQPRHDLFVLTWAIAADDHPAPCAFSVSLVPENDATGVVVVETSTSDVEQGPTFPSTPWGPSAGGSWDSFTVSIRSGCTWAMTLWPGAHD
jgi:hypothetical protein